MNFFDMCTLGFFTDYPTENLVQDEIEYGHDKTGTLESLTYMDAATIALTIDDEIDLALTVEDEIDVAITVE